MATSIAVTLPRPTVAASSSFTVTMLRDYVDSPLSDAVLQSYLSAAFEDIAEALGPLTTTERIRAGRGDILSLSRDAEEIVTVIDDASYSAVTLAADDYDLSDSGRLLYRLPVGTNPGRSWRGRVDVTYRRENNVNSQIRVAVALVKLDLSNAPGLTSQTIGTWSETYAGAGSHSYDEERAALLAGLSDMVGIT